MGSVAFDDEDAKEWAASVKLEDMDVHADKSLPEKDIQELRAAKDANKELIKKYSYSTSDGYKLVKIKSNSYKTVYVNKYGLKDLKGYKSTDSVYKKIPKSIYKIKYDKKLSKKIWNSEWNIKKIKRGCDTKSQFFLILIVLFFFNFIYYEVQSFIIDINIYGCFIHGFKR